MSTDETAATPARPLSQMTAMEKVSWVVFGLGCACLFVSLVLFAQTLDSYREVESAAPAWAILGGAITGAGFMPAVLLGGIRQLLASRGVSGGE